MEQVKLQIDGKEIVVEKGVTVIEAARKTGIDIPSLCHDSRLEPFGACRLCFVNIQGAPKPVTACSTVVADGMVITTENEILADIRKSGLELLLSNHHGDCIAPCQVACPASIDIQGYLAYIAHGQHLEAAKLIKEKLPFASAVGRVCPRFCEVECRRQLVDEPIAICTTKGFAGDQDLYADEPFTPEVKPETGKSVAIIGGGPAGLTAAYYIRQAGHNVTIFEAEEKLGGMIRYGIPEYRLPKMLLDREIEQIIKIGIDVKLNKAMGKDFTLKSLKEDGFDAIFVAIGCWENTQVDLPGRDLPGVYSGIGMLKEVIYGNKVDLGEKVAIMGGGNTAMDAARTAVRLGAKEVTVIYRRTEKEMPADPREIKDAKEEGVKFQFLTNPTSIKGTDRVTSVECVEMVLGEPDASGRRRPIVKEDSEFDIQIDSLILAIGQIVDLSALKGSEELNLDKWNCIGANEANLITSVEGVFTAGDCATGARTVVEAVGQARKAASSINKYLAGEEVVPEVVEYNHTKGKLREVNPDEFKDVERKPRIKATHLAPEDRIDNFNEVEFQMTEEMAMKEAARCLSCGCQEAFDCRLRDLSTKYGIVEAEVMKLGYVHPIIDDHSYIQRDINKCILCGNCVRICKEVQGASALGFIARGLETVVKPTLDEALSDSPCESCGQCISTCPTGALVAKVALPKPGPWRTKSVDTVCPHCSIGCNLTVHLAGQKMVEVTAVDSEINKGNLCVKGSFEFSPKHANGRITSPMLANGAGLEEKPWNESIKAAVSGLQKIIKENGADSLAVVVSPKVTNETAYMAEQLAKKAFGTNNMGIMGQVAPELTPYLVASGGVSFDNLEASDLIVMFNTDAANDYPIIAQRIRKAINMGTPLVIVSHEENKLDRQASSKLDLGNAKDLETLEELKSAKSVFVICDSQNLTLAQLSFLSELVKVKGGSISVLEPAGNYRGTRTILNNTHLNYQAVVKGVQDETIKGLVIVADEDGVDSQLLANNHAFTIVISPVKQEELANVKVVLPGTAFVETRGSYTNSEGKQQIVNNPLMPLAGKEVWSILSELTSMITGETSLDYNKLASEVQSFWKN